MGTFYGQHGETPSTRIGNIVDLLLTSFNKFKVSNGFVMEETNKHNFDP